MKTTLRLHTQQSFLPDIRCNGKLLKLVSKGGFVYTAEFETQDNQPQHLHIFKHYTLSDRLWFVYGLLFWILGFFGIFTPRWEKKCPSVDMKFTLEQPQDLIELSLHPLTMGYRALSLNGAQAHVLDIPSNVYTTNTLAEKRAKKVKILSILTFLVSFPASIFLALYLYIN